MFSQAGYTSGAWLYLLNSYANVGYQKQPFFIPDSHLSFYLAFAGMRFARTERASQLLLTGLPLP